MDSAKSDSEIQTLVFFDTETTGLAHLIGKRNVRITELALVAVDRREFESDNENIRVVNKLNLVFNPSYGISSGAAEVSGLTDSLVEFQETFTNSAKLIELFLKRLNKPICILAQNGNRFDFPLLKAEFNHSGVDTTGLMFCADTLPAFKSILSKTDIKIESRRLADTIRNVSLGDKSINGKDEPTDERHISEDRKSCKSLAGKRLSTNRDVKENTSVDKKSPLKSYTLGSIYKYIFLRPQPDAHEAEADALALLKMAKKLDKRFLAWMEENRVPFEDINSLWE